MQEEVEMSFFRKACFVRNQILNSDSDTKEIELDVLSKVVQQVFFHGNLPYKFILTPYPRHSYTDFFNAVDYVFSSLDITYVKSKQTISAHVTKTNYIYTRSETEEKN